MWIKPFESGSFQSKKEINWKFISEDIMYRCVDSLIIIIIIVFFQP